MVHALLCPVGPSGVVPCCSGCPSQEQGPGWAAQCIRTKVLCENQQSKIQMEQPVPACVHGGTLLIQLSTARVGSGLGSPVHAHHSILLVLLELARVWQCPVDLVVHACCNIVLVLLERALQHSCLTGWLEHLDRAPASAIWVEGNVNNGPHWHL